MSATKTGTPAADSCSAISCRVRVLPVPVAPATSPCRLNIASGIRTFGSGCTREPSSAAPRTMEASSKPYPVARASAKVMAVEKQSRVEGRESRGRKTSGPGEKVGDLRQLVNGVEEVRAQPDRALAETRDHARAAEPGVVTNGVGGAHADDRRAGSTRWRSDAHPSPRGEIEQRPLALPGVLGDAVDAGLEQHREGYVERGEVLIRQGDQLEATGVGAKLGLVIGKVREIVGSLERHPPRQGRPKHRDELAPDVDEPGPPG